MYIGKKKDHIVQWCILQRECYSQLCIGIMAQGKKGKGKISCYGFHFTNFKTYDILFVSKIFTHRAIYESKFSK
jgi:hypothetical protein